MKRRSPPKRSNLRRARVAEAAPLYSTAPTRLLLDTQVWIWWRAADDRLGPAARLVIEQAAEVYFSAASAWEIAIKTGTGKLDVPPGSDIDRDLAKLGFLPLSVSIVHAMGVAALPHIHRDPFDRLLVAQAIAEQLTLVTADRLVARYPVSVLSALE